MEYYFRYLLEALKDLAWPILVAAIILCFRRQIALLLAVLPRRARSFKLNAGKFGVEVQLSDYESRDLVLGKMAVAEQEQRENTQIVRDFNEAMNEAVRFSGVGNHRQAIVALKRANRTLPDQWIVLHNLSVEQIRWAMEGAPNRAELLVEAEIVCQQAILASDKFPYGTYYNLARAQGQGGNIVGLRQTLIHIKSMQMPRNLALALCDGDPHIRTSEEIASLPEYKETVEAMRKLVRQPNA